MRGMRSGMEDQAIQFRRRHLQFLSVLGFAVAVLMSIFSIAWDMWEVAVPSFFYAPICLYTVVMLRRKPEYMGRLATLFIVATLSVTQTGVFLQKPGAITDPWIMTCPLVVYGLCDRKLAAGWTVITVLLLIAMRPFQPYVSATPQTTVVLVLAVVSFAAVQHLYSRRTEDNERLIVELSNTDSLTGTLNRRAFREILPSEFRRNQRQRSSLTAFMLDVDHFKNYNDHHGHVEGDRVLAAIGQTLRQTARRSGDFVFRYGGEEFCVLGSGLNAAQAAAFAAQLRANVEALRIEHRAAAHGRVTASIGYCHAEELDALTPQRLIEEADRALYLAKDKRRNRVERFINAAAA